jgi:hypothetical protein
MQFRLINDVSVRFLGKLLSPTSQDLRMDISCRGTICRSYHSSVKEVIRATNVKSPSALKNNSISKIRFNAQFVSAKKTSPFLRAKSDNIDFLAVITLSLFSRARACVVKSLVKGLALVAAVAVSLSLLAVRQVYAQAGFSPGIEGVSYGEMAQWSSRYGGGGFPGCDFPPPPYCGPAYFHPAAVQRPPSPCRAPKFKRGKKRK